MTSLQTFQTVNYDEDSSDDNLFDIDEWDHTKSTFQDEIKEDLVITHYSLHERINSVAHTVDNTFSAKSNFECSIDFNSPQMIGLTHEMTKLFHEEKSRTNQSKPSSPLPYSPRNVKYKNPLYASIYGPYCSYSPVPKKIPPIKASKHEMFKNEISSHILGNDLLLDDVINDMAISVNNDHQPIHTRLDALGEDEHEDEHQDQDVDDIDNQLLLNDSDGINDLDVIHDINNAQTGENGEKQEHKDESKVITMECESVQKCVSLKRIITCLDFYDNIIENDKNDENETESKTLHDSIAIIDEYFNNYPEFLNDYHHILSQHLNDGKIQNEINFEIIYNKIHKYIKCDLSKCSAYIRLNRDRDDIRLAPLIDNKINNKINNNVSFYIDMMDTIHCYFIHSYDCGFKINSTNLMKELKEGTQIEHLYNDEKLKSLQSSLIKKRGELLCMKGDDFINMNKFNNKLVNKVDVFNNKHANERKNTLDYMENKYNSTDYHQYDTIFGIKTYHWDWYKDNTSNDPFNKGYQYKDWYIIQKYDNLKHEILNNKNGNQLDIKQFNESYNKSLTFINTNYLRNVLKTENNFKDYKVKMRILNDQNISYKLYYDINDNDPISVQHILSIILYCDYMKLSYNFRNSFRKLCIDSFYETDNEFKCRKRGYWHWTKLMSECVEIYGEWISTSKNEKFYTGISRKYIFNKFYANFVCPISVTNELCVTSMYCDNKKGCILELNCNTSPLSLFVKYFDCSFLSNYPHENEYVFLGGCINGKSLNISSIRCMKSNENYKCFIHAINIFLRCINGQRIDLFDEKSKANKIDYMIIDQLIAHKIALNDINHNYDNKYPKYINETFKTMINNQKLVKLSVYNIKTMFSKLRKYFISSIPNNNNNNKNSIDYISYESIIALFPHCNEIIVEMTNSNNIIFINDLLILLKMISAISNFSRLQKIKLENIANKYNEKDLKIIKTGLNKLDWNMTIKQMDGTKYINKYQYIIYKKLKQNLATKFKNIFISK